MSAVPYIPENAPFSPEQRGWLNGYLAGLFSRGPVDPSALQGLGEGSAAPAVRRLVILYGSQTGTAEGLAMESAEKAQNLGYQTEVKELNDVEPAALCEEKRLLVITSTYGDGEMPDNAQEFWEQLSAEEAPALPDTHYSVLALGDTNYETFCSAGKDLDERLAGLGATCVQPRVDCDVDYEEPFEAWLDQALQALQLGEEEGQEAAAPAESAPAAKKSAYSKKQPFVTSVLENRLLTTEASGKEVRHYAIRLPEEELTYEAGDALNVFPENDPADVEAFLVICNVDGATDVEVGGRTLPLSQALCSELDIRTPTKPLVSAIAEKNGSEALLNLVNDSDAFAEYLWGRELRDVMADAGGSWTAQELVDLLKPLQPRAYSISSSPGMHPGEVHLCVASVRYEAQGRAQKGVCSTFLADRAGEGPLRVFVSANKAFAVPENTDLPMIMVGPGTGIAPFRAFLEERKVQGAAGKNWLFFGDRNEASDFLYRDEVLAYREEGLLSELDLAWSRDQEEKLYVQHLMVRKGAELFTWLEEGAYFFVCGDAHRMAKDVEQALLEIISEQGGLDSDGAQAYLSTMKKEKRYVRDVY